ncbi:MAG: hypothetical protein NWQ30_04915, partial [Alishewanella sp.]|nr:hypothetical protein [Alishewanella sp.]
MKSTRALVPLIVLNLAFIAFHSPAEPPVVSPQAAQSLTQPAFSGPSPWPDILQQRIATLLPKAMDHTGVTHW